MNEWFININGDNNLIINADYVVVDNGQAYFYVTSDPDQVIAHMKEYISFHSLASVKLHVATSEIKEGE